MRCIEFADGNREAALANAPPHIRAKVLRSRGQTAAADEIERHHMSPREYAALQEERASNQATSDDETETIRARLKLLSMTA
jgi:hypothetical protein